MEGVLVVLLLVCACAYTQVIYHKPYVESYQQIKLAIQEVENLLPQDDGSLPLDDKIRHSTVIVYTLQELGKLTTSCLDVYDVGYLDAVDESIVHALKDPQDAADKVRDVLSLVEIHSIEVTNLIDLICPFIDDNNRCNRVIDAIVESNHELYEKAGKLVLAAGSAALTFNELSEEIEIVAENEQEIAYFLNSKDLLREPAHEIGEVLRIVNPNPLECQKDN